MRYRKIWRQFDAIGVSLVAMSGLSLAAVPASGQMCEWNLEATAGPDARDRHALAYDSNRGVTVLYGGNSTFILADTWEWDGSTWSQGPAGPGAIKRHAMAFDSARNVTVLFGGFPTNNLTWEYDGSNWTQVSMTGPIPRYNHAMAYDSDRGVTVLFGGIDSAVQYLDDAWEWDGSSWTQVASGPPGRAWHAMAFDSSRNVTVLYGGWDGVASLGDTWEWDGSNWMQITTGTPPSRWGPAMAFDSDRGVTVLFGGSGGPDQTWEWDGVSWSQVSGPGPTPRLMSALAYDSGGFATVLFGGNGDLSQFTMPLSDTWEYQCDAPGFDLSLTGTCPGQMTASVVNATPGGTVGFVFGARDGQTTIPSGPCRGTVLPVASNVQLVATARANANGEASITGNAPSPACGGRLVALDAPTCEVSNVVVVR